MDETGCRKGEVPGCGGPDLPEKDEVEEIMNRATLGNAEAQYGLGLMYRDGKGLPQKP